MEKEKITRPTDDLRKELDRSALGDKLVSVLASAKRLVTLAAISPLPKEDQVGEEAQDDFTVRGRTVLTEDSLLIRDAFRRQREEMQASGGSSTSD